MTHEELKSRLPHRDAMLLIGEVEEKETDENRVAVGKTYIRGDEWFLQGHFPGNPVVPGVILCEIMAQSACVLIECSDMLPLFSGMKNVKWKHPVRPGDTLETEVVLTRRMGAFCFAKGVGKVNGNLALEAEFSFALTPASALESKPE